MEPEDAPLRNLALASVDYNLYFFALANHDNKRIYVTGGEARGSEISNPNCIFNLDSHTFSHDVPPLRNKRRNHSSTATANTIAVFGGDYKGRYLSSIELLDVS